MGHYLDLDSWPRASTFEFYRDYELPFLGITAPVEVTETLERCRLKGYSFALASWFLCMMAANEIPEFRYRLRDDGVWVHDQITVGTTVLNDNDTFAFCYYEYDRSFERFAAKAREAQQVLAASGGQLEARDGQDDLIHGSIVPWVSFTNVINPRRFRSMDSVPKVVLGRYERRDGKFFMPVAVEAHHALVDGLHVARFFERFGELLANPRHMLSP